MGNILGNLLGINQNNQANALQNAANTSNNAALTNLNTVAGQGNNQLNQYNSSYNPLIAQYAQQAGLNVPGLNGADGKPVAGGVGSGAGGAYALNIAQGNNPIGNNASQANGKNLQAPGGTASQNAQANAAATAAANPLYDQMTPAQQAQVSQQIDTINQQKQAALAQSQQVFDTNGINYPSAQAAYIQQLNEQFDAMANNTVTAAANQANATQQQADVNVLQMLGAEGTQGVSDLSTAASGQANIASGQQNTALQEQQQSMQAITGLLSAIGAGAGAFNFGGATADPTAVSPSVPFGSGIGGIPSPIGFS